MLTSSLAVLVASALSGVQAAPQIAPRADDLESYLKTQEPIALKGVLANIGSSGSKVDGAADGIVVASPSKSDPDYFYTWTRDAALTLKALIERFIVTKDADLEKVIKAYVTSQTKLQKVSNPSGDIDSGGLGEPKFNVDMSAFTGEWGRPQRDGPALRATALIAYGNYLINQNKTDSVKSDIWPLVKNDLNYVANNWNQTGFDLWEEVEGSSFFTVLAQHRSLVEGGSFAKKLDQDANFDEEASSIRCYLADFWNKDEGYATADFSESTERSGKGTQTFIASNHGFDLKAGCSDATFQPCSAKALSNLYVVSNSFSEWALNSDSKEGAAKALGRYSEDTYMSGNPWYLTTSAAAEQLYLASAQWEEAGSIEVTDVSLPFFKAVADGAATGTYKKGTDKYTAITKGVKTLADAYLSIVAKYTPDGGAMAEQFGKSDGKPLSAADLTWSYAALLTAKAARDGDYPATWGASGLKACDA